MKSNRVGRTSVPNKTAMSGNGSGLTKRDSATNTSTSDGGGTKHLRNGQVTRTMGSFAGYKKNGN